MTQKSALADPAAQAGPPAPALVTEDWVECGRCTKWRRIPEHEAAALDDNTPWYCEMNAESAFASCSVPQEPVPGEAEPAPAAGRKAEGLGAKEEGEARRPTSSSLSTPSAVTLKPASNADSEGRSGVLEMGELGQRTREVHDWASSQGKEAHSFNGTTPEAHLSAAARRRRPPAGPPVWQQLRDNVYLHRPRKVQDEDDIMICSCPPLWPSDAADCAGCGERCLNRMLNIECVAEHCPSGDRCSNRQFSLRQYAPLDVRRAGAKGHGLFAAADLAQGQFVLEYVGEVLAEGEYRRRRAFYAARGQRHFYFMNCGNGEVIDASRRGGQGRFINHSCAPNCETQKWVVGGELAIGLFTLRAVTRGEELTFDYNFERYGDKPMRCLCGSDDCRGVIGGAGRQAEANKRGEEDRRAATSPSPSPPPSEASDSEPEPLMLGEHEDSAALRAALDSVVGQGPGEGRWSRGDRRQLRRWCAQRGVALGALLPGGGEEESEGEREEGREEEREEEREGELEEEREEEREGERDTTRARTRDSRRESSPASTSVPLSAGRSRAPRAAPSKAQQPFRPSISQLALADRREVAPPAPHMAWRTEVDRRVESCLGPQQRVRPGDERSALLLLRLFNLCDVAPTAAEARAQAAERLEGTRRGAGGSLASLTPRQRARAADLSLLLGVVDESARRSAAVARQWLDAGLLRQLLGTLGGGGSGPHLAVVLRKALRVVSALRPAAQDAREARSAHGSFRDWCRALREHADAEVRDLSCGVLAQWGEGPGLGGASPLNVGPVVARRSLDAPERAKNEPQASFDERAKSQLQTFSTPWQNQPSVSPWHQTQQPSASPWQHQSAPKRSRWEAATGSAPQLDGSASRSLDAREPSAPLSPPSPPPLPPPVPLSLAEFKAPLQTSFAESWESPDGEFARYVRDIVRYRLAKYMQPDHPAPLDLGTAQKLVERLAVQIAEREREAYEERMASGTFKPILRDKTAQRVKEYVRDTMHRMHGVA